MPSTTSLVMQKGAGSMRALHPHRNEGLEIVSVTQGTLIWQVEGRSHVVKPGSIFFTLPWQTHGSVFEFEPGHHWNFVVLRLEMQNPMHPGPFRFPEALGFSAAETRQISALLRRQTRHVIPGTRELRETVSALSLLPPKSPYSHRRQVALATMIIIGLAEGIVARTESRDQSVDAHRIAKVIDLLRQDPARSWTMGEIAASTGLRKSRFSELFLRETGDTLIEFINRLRVECARSLLRKSLWDITRIAHECGFSSSQYFAKTFRKFTGLSASEFRASSLK